MTEVRGALIRALTRPPFHDACGRKGLFEWVARAQPHVTRHLKLEIPGWPRWRRPIRIAFLSDFHVGSHSGDVARLATIVADAARAEADLILFGGDYVNLQPVGGGRVPPHAIAPVLARLHGQLGRFAILGNHDCIYGGTEVAEAFRTSEIALLQDEWASVRYENDEISLLGLPDGEIDRPEPPRLLAAIDPDCPTIVLSHDPVWFAHMPAGQLMLAGHTHGGQVKLPFIGPITNQSKAPLRWSYGLIKEDGRYLYVTSGLGSSFLPIRIGVPPEIVILDVTGA